MVLTSGQTYFFIFCCTAVLITLIQGIVTIIKIRKINSPCSELRKVQEEVIFLRNIVRRLSRDARRST